MCISVHTHTHTHMLYWSSPQRCCSVFMCFPLAVSPVMWTVVSVTFQPHDCLVLCNITYFWVMLSPLQLSRRFSGHNKALFQPSYAKEAAERHTHSFYTHDARMTVHIQRVSYYELAVRSVTNIFTHLKQQSFFFFFFGMIFKAPTITQSRTHVTRFCISCVKRTRLLVG